MPTTLRKATIKKSDLILQKGLGLKLLVGYQYIQNNESSLSYYQIFIQIMSKAFLAASVALSAFLLADKKKAQCCGIIGIVSSKQENIAPSLSLGVELLKNRGYDSAGIVVFSKQNEKTEYSLIKKAQEKDSALNCIQRLVEQVSKQIVKSHIGIGHTRWATCGEKVEKNAHPHFDRQKRIFLVHNGIIGGHSIIKAKYLDDVVFSSETDSEVIVQLLSKFRKQGMSMVQAIRKTEQIMTVNSEKPQWGLVIMDREEPNKIWTSTNGSPIIIGINNEEIYVASEPIAFKKSVQSYFVTKSGEVWELSVDQIENIKKELSETDRMIKVSLKDKQQVQVHPPQPYKSFYSYEIRQQSQIQFKPEFQRVKAVPFGPYLTFVACGSSYYAALASFYFFKMLKAFKKVSIFDPAQMLENDIVQNETVVVISQSGETKDLINRVIACRNMQGTKTIGIINVEGSTIARKVDFPIYIKVGREVSVAATKSMFHQCLNLIMLSLEVARKKQSAPQELILEIEKQLLSMPSQVAKTIQMVQDQCQKIANILYKKESIYLLAQREALAIAKEAALKIKELNYIHAEALGACEMKHGPIALINSQCPKETAVILFVLDNQTFEQLANAVDQMLSRNAHVILVTDCKEKILTHYGLDKPEKQQQKEKMLSNIQVISVPHMKHLSYIQCLIPMQILVQKIAELKKINPDMPRNLAKTVTV